MNKPVKQIAQAEEVSPDKPYTLADPNERQRRVAMANADHMKPLTDYLSQVREHQKEKRESNDLPAFDPCDGGIHARVLFLLEAPGPKAVSSLFISRNNPDPTARNFCELLVASGIPRADTIIWNIVPWYVGSGTKIRPVTRKDITEALPYLSDLLALLPDLQVITLVGRKAQSTMSEIRTRTDLPFVSMPHPSAQVFNIHPEKRAEAAAVLVAVAALLKKAAEEE